MTTISKSDLWKQIKAINNPAKFLWSTPKNVMLEFLEKYNKDAQRMQQEEESISTEILCGKGDAFVNKQSAEKLNHILDGMQEGQLIRVNDKLFKFNGNNSQTIQIIFQWIGYEEELTDIYVPKIIDALPNKQVYRLGDVNCLFAPVQQMLQAKFDQTESKHTEAMLKTMLNKIQKLKPEFDLQGATPKLIQKLADDTKSKITIYEVISQTKTVYKASSVQRKFKFKFQNVRYNHVDIWANGKNQERTLSDEDFQSYIQKLNEEKQSYKVQFVNEKIVKINTGFETVLLDEYQQLLDAEQIIDDQTKDLELRINKFQQDFIYNAVKIAGCKLVSKKIMNPNDLKHIDMKCGYSNFQTVPEEYKFGFPYITESRNCEGHAINFAFEHNGIYQVKIQTRGMPWFVQEVFGCESIQFLTSPVIKFLHDLGVGMTLLNGMFGKHSKHIQLDESAYKQHCGRKAYYTKFSKFGISSDTFPEHFVSYDEELAQVAAYNIKSNGQNTVYKIADNLYAMNLQKKNDIQYIESTGKSRLHLFVYILQYQLLNMCRQLGAMDQSKIALICGDDIYYRDHQFQMLDIFRHKPENKYELLLKMAEDKYIREIHDKEELAKSFNFGEKIQKIDQCVLTKAPGGFGKTTRILADTGNVGLTYITLTNKLVCEMKKQNPGLKAYTIDNFKAKFEQKKICCQNLIIDEIGLCGSGIIHWVKRNLPNVKMHVLGDDLQICGYGQTKNAIEDADAEDDDSGDGNIESPFDEKLYDKIILEDQYKIDYRAKKCLKLQELKQRIRAAMRQGKTESWIYQNLVIPNSNQISEQEWINQYNNNKLILTCSINQKDSWVPKLIDKHKKYRVNKCFVLDGKKYNTGDLLTELPQNYCFADDQKLKKPKIVLAFASTTHSIQGQTHRDQLLIMKPIELDIFRGYCYTAVSRLTKIQDLFVIV